MIIKHSDSKPIIKAASACIWRGEEVLLVQRGSALGRGRWSLPGGKLEPGETTLVAAHRELMEETGVTATLSQHVGDFSVELPELIYAISCFTGPFKAGEAVASTDASAVAWTHWKDIHSYQLAPNIIEAVAIAHKLISV
jgi:8-oxo-dGTP diphosphatase